MYKLQPPLPLPPPKKVTPSLPAHYVTDNHPVGNMQSCSDNVSLVYTKTF